MIAAKNWLLPAEPKSAVLLLFACLLASQGCTKTKSTDEMLADLNQGKEPDRIAAARLLPGRREDAAKIIPGLIDALSDHDADVRASAANGLGSFGPEAAGAIAKLEALTKDRDARVRRAAATALERIGGKP